MKIIDKHISLLVVVPLLGLLGILFGIWVVYDLVDRLNEFMQSQTTPVRMALFYLKQIPAVIPVILPISTLLACLSSLALIVRNGELIALMSGGIGLSRISLPYIVTAVSAGTLNLYVESCLAPLSIRERNTLIEEVRAQAANRERRVGVQLRSLVYFNDNDNRIWFIRRANPINQELIDVEILQLDSQNKDKWKIFARQMKYDATLGWSSSAAIVVKYSSDGSVESKTSELHTEIAVLLKESFTQVAASIFTPDVMTFSELSSFLQINKALSSERRSPYLSMLVRQLWSFAPCVGIVMVVLGLCMRTSSRSDWSGLGIPIGLYICYVLLDQLCLTLGKSARLPAVFIVSLPQFLWLATGLFFYLTRIKKLC